MAYLSSPVQRDSERVRAARLAYFSGMPAPPAQQQTPTPKPPLDDVQRRRLQRLQRFSSPSAGASNADSPAAADHDDEDLQAALA
eukprot:881693-Prymnesium_polylepis.1